jgi:hypothetical protein
MNVRTRVNLDDLRLRLPNHAREIALALLGKPTIATAREWPWGRPRRLPQLTTNRDLHLWRS